ncbi:MAG: hypothetical protein GDA55_06720 [Cellvibrionales bacterium]|nr:hypothetical protein [Cellvibrionales bacterium]
MDNRRADLVIAIEQCILQALDGHRGRSNTKTSLLHGAIQKYIDPENKIHWQHEIKLEEQSENTFNVDIFAAGVKNDRGCPR